MMVDFHLIIYKNKYGILKKIEVKGDEELVLRCGDKKINSNELVGFVILGKK